MSTYPTLDDTKLDHLVSASFLLCKVTIFTFVINEYFLGKHSGMNILFLIKPSPTRLSIH